MMSKARGHKRQGKSDVKISSSNAKLAGNLILKDLSFKQINSKYIRNVKLIARVAQAVER